MKSKPYPKYKASGVEWLGAVPEHWGALPLKRIVAIPVTDGPHETPEILDEGIPFVSAEAIRSNKIDFNRKRGFIAESEHRKFCLKYHPKRDDIYMIKSGATTGNLAIVETDEEFSIWSPLAVVRVHKEKANARFVLAAMNSKEFQTSVQLFWSFGTQQNIGMNVIENLFIPLPPLPEQQAIATFLDHEMGRIDSLIAKKLWLLELLAEQRTALISRAVTKGLDTSVKLKPSGVEWLGDIPEHWEVWKLAHLTTRIGSGKTPTGGAEVYQNEGILFIRSQNVYDGGLYLDDVVYIDEKTDEEMAWSRVKPLDILLNITGASLGRTCIVPRDLEKANVNQHVCVIRLRNSDYSHFIAHYLKSRPAKSFYDFVQTGSAREGLNFEQIGAFPVPLPPLREQQAIAAFLDRETAKIDALSAKVTTVIERLKEYRTALISSAVTGKIDVSTEFNNSFREAV